MDIWLGSSPDKERQALARERERLGFDPSRQPEYLRGEGGRSAKRALANLTEGKREREAQCVASTPIEHLRQRGRRCGLAVFLDEIEQKVVPAIV